MAKLTITARFPLGVFQGHAPDGDTSDDFPHTARLYQALIHSAGKGSAALVRGADLRVSPESVQALEWLEANPPDAIELPPWIPFGRSDHTASYRDEGTLTNRASTRKTKFRIVNRAVAVGGSFGWCWNEAPKDVVDVVTALCADVSCLGEADSPVVLDTSVELEAPLVRLSGLGQLSRRGIAVRTPIPGRLEELEEAYDIANPRRPPSTSADRASGNQLPSPAPVPHRSVHPVKYGSAAVATPADPPWTRAILFGVPRPVPLIERVRWCVSFHRMLAQRLGDNAPTVITGKYARGVQQPANRVAVHYLSPGLPTTTLLEQPAFALMLPGGIEPADEIVLRRALVGRLKLYRGGKELPLEILAEVALENFWQPPQQGRERWWAPVPALVPETRRQQSGAWTFEHAAKLSIGFLYRQQLYPDYSVPRGEAGYREVVDRVEQSAVRVRRTHIIADSRAEVYAHKLPEGVLCQPYAALLDLGDLAGDRQLLAAGQSRHVGGGLLVPTDVTSDEAETWVL